MTLSSLNDARIMGEVSPWMSEFEMRCSLPPPPNSPPFGPMMSLRSTDSQYPLAYIEDGKTTLVDTYPIKPAELMAAKQWHDTKDFAFEVVFASAEKAHVILRQATRIRLDGSPIETVSCFYALTRTPSGWKFFAISDITITA